MSDPCTETAQPPKPTFWQRRVVDPIVRQLTQGITPEKIALTLAVGTALAFFPILGTTTILCLIAGIVLRLNQPFIQLVNALCAIPHLLVIYGLVCLGGLMFGAPHPHLTVADFIYRAPHSHLNIWILLRLMVRKEGLLLHRIEATAVHAIVAWLIIAPVWILVVYWSTLTPLRNFVRRRAESAGQTEEIKPSAHPVP